MKKNVKIVPYNSNWPVLFEAEAIRIKSSLENNFVAIHHIGSTSVPGLDSKNKIDICLQVKEGNVAISALEELGYEYSGEWNIPFKYGFRYRKEISINLHMFDFGHPVIELNLLFRDSLRQNEQIRKEYTKLKHEILEKPNSHKKEHKYFYNYTLHKNYFIQKTLKNYNFKKRYIQYCNHKEEWEAANRLQDQCYIEDTKHFDKQKCTSGHIEHKHFILYNGVDIIGYTKIYIKQNKQANISIFTIDSKQRKKGFGREFFELIEKWLRCNNYKNVSVMCSEISIGFYKKLGFILGTDEKQSTSQYHTLTKAL